MTINSKRKGKTGELELAHALKALGFTNSRRGQQYQGSPDSPDVIAIPGVHIECKRTETFSLYPALEQAINDAGEAIPVVIHRRNRKPWVVVVRLDDLLELVDRVRQSLKEV